jgi:hypothetical protein
MSTPFPITIGDKQYTALPPSFAFQKARKSEMKRLEAGQMAGDESQEYMASVIVHCIKRAMPELDVADLEDRLDSVEITRASVEIGRQIHMQTAAVLGVDALGERKAG